MQPDHSQHCAPQSAADSDPYQLEFPALTTQKEKFRLVSLFSGAGGFDSGFYRTSRFVTCFANELKETPCRTFAQNFGVELIEELTQSTAGRKLIVQGDIKNVSFAHLKGLEPDVLIGGPPCQDFSAVKGGRNRGIKVQRGKAYAHFVRAVVALQPKIFVFENVPGLTWHTDGEAYRIIQEDFEQLNLRWHYIRQAAHFDRNGSDKPKIKYKVLFNKIVDAVKLGVPQMRQRLFIIGLREDLVAAVKRPLEKYKQDIEMALTGSASLFGSYPLTTIEVLEGRALPDLAEQYRSVIDSYRDICKTGDIPAAAAWKEEVLQHLSGDIVPDYLWSSGQQAYDSSEFNRAMIEHEALLKRLGYFKRPVSALHVADNSNVPIQEAPATYERMRMIPPGENYRFVNGTKWEVEGKNISFIYRRSFPLKPAPTVIAFGGGGTHGYHYERQRSRMTNRERARIQTFDDNFLFVGRPTEIRAQIGEAVPPLLAERIAEVLIPILCELK